MVSSKKLKRCINDISDIVFPFLATGGLMIGVFYLMAVAQRLDRQIAENPYGITRNANRTEIYNRGGVSRISLVDNNNDGSIDEKYVGAFMAKPSRFHTIKLPITEEDQRLYQGLLAKLGEKR